MMEDARNIRRLGHSDLNGHPDAMQLMLQDHVLYVGHVDGKVGTSLVDVSDPTNPTVIDQLPAEPHTHSHKIQVADNKLIVNVEQHPKTAPVPARAGFKIYDISQPERPQPLGFFNTGGKGVHRAWYTGGDTVYASARPPGFRERIMVIADISDPMAPREISKWWWPGMADADQRPVPWEEGRQNWGVHHPVVHQDRAYVGFWGGGLLIFDIADLTKPEVISHTPWSPGEGGSTHTALPLPERNLLVVADESNAPFCQEDPRRVRLFDISDEKNPQFISMFPEPQGDFCERGGRFGPHNVHEHQPGSAVSDQFIYVTYFNAGLRVYDISDAANPIEVAHYIPPCKPYAQTNDVYVAANGLIYISDRVHGGIDILELTL